ncbi:MAG: DUF6788 family protein [Candidatus Omnitrophota bacterium]
MGIPALLAKRHSAVRNAPKIAKIMKGSIVIVKRYCGKPNCRCRRGFKHRSLYVSLTDKGKQRLVYIPRRSEEKTRRLIANYRDLKTVVEKISRLNVSLMTVYPKAPE